MAAIPASRDALQLDAGREIQLAGPSWRGVVLVGFFDLIPLVGRAGP